MPTSSNNKEIAINICKLSKVYKIIGANSKGLQTITALDNINLSIKKGEIVGLIGPNGSGKSTLLKILSRVSNPDGGYAELSGKVASILEIGTGFNQDLSGRENIYLNASLHGIKKKAITTKINNILDIFGFPEFIDTPVKHYSSGMYMRLAFAVVINIEADIYLFDEVLSVGDLNFQKKSITYLRKLKELGKTAIIVTHTPELIIEISDKLIILDKGTIYKQGEPQNTIMEYHQKILSSYTNSNELLLKTHVFESDFIHSKKAITKDKSLLFNLNEVMINLGKQEQIFFNEEIILDFVFTTELKNDLTIGFTLKNNLSELPLVAKMSDTFRISDTKQYTFRNIFKPFTFNAVTITVGFFVLYEEKPIFNYYNVMSFQIQKPIGQQGIEYFSAGIFNPEIKSSIL